MKITSPLLLFLPTLSTAFLLSTPPKTKLPTHLFSSSSSSSSSSTTSTTTTTSNLSSSIANLKKILTREYVTFFDPMYTEYYSPTVTFDDPMTSFSGVSSYQNNVDMLAGRTLLGNILFEDAGIVLHTVSGGSIRDDGTIEDIITRWTLRVSAKVLPWKPTARFTGVSVYKVSSSSDGETVQIDGQVDYWDSVNLRKDGSGDYQKVQVQKAIGDFLNQLKPGGLEARQAGMEVPYQLLRRGEGYEVRRYPEVAVVNLPYTRRDEGFGSLGSFTRGMNPLSPAIMTVPTSDTSNKYMSWPISYASPSSPLKIPDEATSKVGQGQWRTVSIDTLPAKTIAVLEFNDASMEPVVKKADRELRVYLKLDGLVPKEGSEEELKFAQYDAVYSMGKRRGEVWIELEDSAHPW